MFLLVLKNPEMMPEQANESAGWKEEKHLKKEKKKWEGVTHRTEQLISDRPIIREESVFSLLIGS